MIRAEIVRPPAWYSQLVLEKTSSVQHQKRRRAKQRLSKEPVHHGGSHVEVEAFT